MAKPVSFFQRYVSYDVYPLWALGVGAVGAITFFMVNKSRDPSFAWQKEARVSYDEQFRPVEREPKSLLAKMTNKSSSMFGMSNPIHDYSKFENKDFKNLSLKVVIPDEDEEEEEEEEEAEAGEVAEGGEAEETEAAEEVEAIEAAEEVEAIEAAEEAPAVEEVTKETLSEEEDVNGVVVEKAEAEVVAVGEAEASAPEKTAPEIPGEDTKQELFVREKISEIMVKEEDEDTIAYADSEIIPHKLSHHGEDNSAAAEK